LLRCSVTVVGGVVVLLVVGVVRLVARNLAFVVLLVVSGVVLRRGGGRGSLRLGGMSSSSKFSSTGAGLGISLGLSLGVKTLALAKPLGNVAVTGLGGRRCSRRKIGGCVLVVERLVLDTSVQEGLGKNSTHSRRASNFTVRRGNTTVKGNFGTVNAR